MRPVALVMPLILSLAGCATVRPAPAPPIAAAPTQQVAPAFTGYGNLAVPPRLADGSYATPNRMVSAAGAVWHLRAGLNVAALACPGPDAAVIAAAYNGFLTSHRTAFATAYRTLTAEYGDVAGFDAAMTRLYNYYAQPAAQAGLCSAARAVLADGVLIPPAALADFAPGALARLDAPYVAAFAAQDAWLATRFAARSPAIAARAAVVPYLAVDPAVLLMP